MSRINQSHVQWQKNGFEIQQERYVLQVTVLQEEVIRVRSYPMIAPLSRPCFDASFPISELEEETTCYSDDTSIGMRTGTITVEFDGERIIFLKNNRQMLTEYARLQHPVRRTRGVDDQLPIENERSSSLQIAPHQFRILTKNQYQTYLRFESDPMEKIVGLGGYQETKLNKNGGYYELMQRNSQTSIPMYISDKGYGFMWNHAGIGEVHFAENQYCWSSYQTDYIEYIVFGAETIKEGLFRYTNLVGRAPDLPERYLGLWQSKLRYQTLQELKTVYQGYKERQIDLSVLVIDYFHWPSEGSFEFDERYWRGIERFAATSQTELMVSVWPTVEPSCPFWSEYIKNQLLIQDKETKSPAILFQQSAILDFTCQKTQEQVARKLIQNYIHRGISLFWADQAEPELQDYQHARFQLSKGNFASYASLFPLSYLSAIPNQSSEETRPVLIRSAWFGSQAKGALAWSGDIESSFESLANQIQIALSMGICGQSWWTSDIGGFHAYTSDEAYQHDLMRRWFQFATFSPILRMHGDRQPHTTSIGESGGGVRTSGAGNEIWSFGSEMEEQFTKWLQIRKHLQPYLSHLYQESHCYGYPIMRPLFFEFPEDEECWLETSQYMLGSELLVAPVIVYQQKELEVYLPAGHEWISLFTTTTYEGGKSHRIQLEKDYIPVFIKKGSYWSNSLENITTEWRK